MPFDPTEYARKKAEAKARAESLKADRAARKGELDAEAAQRKAQMDSMRSGKGMAVSSAASTPHAAGQPSIPGSSRSSSAGNPSGSKNDEMAQRLQDLERELSALKQRDHERQGERGRFLRRMGEIEAERRAEKQELATFMASMREQAASRQTLASDASPRIAPVATEPAAEPAPVKAASKPWLKKAAATKSAPKSPESPESPKPESTAPPRPASPKPFATDTAQLDELPVGGASTEPLPSEEASLAAGSTAGIDDLGIGGGGGGDGGGPDPYAVDVSNLVKCDGCGRSFNPKALKVHKKICKKVFQTKRKAFKVEILDSEQMDGYRPPPKLKGKAAAAAKKKEEEKKKKPAKWKAQRDQLRAALRAGREATKAIAEGRDLSTVPVAATIEAADDRVQCPTCNRKFNEDTAKRHMPLCATKAKLAGKKKPAPKKR